MIRAHLRQIAATAEDAAQFARDFPLNVAWLTSLESNIEDMKADLDRLAELVQAEQQELQRLAEVHRG